MGRSLLGVLVLGAAAAGLPAQAPHITPAGDPSIRSDTIYRLAVAPADYPDQGYVYLLDDGVLRVETDGRGSRTYRQVGQILTQDAVDDWGEQAFSYTAGRGGLAIKWHQGVKAEGMVDRA